MESILERFQNNSLGFQNKSLGFQNGVPPPLRGGYPNGVPPPYHIATVIGTDTGTDNGNGTDNGSDTDNARTKKKKYRPELFMNCS